MLFHTLYEGVGRTAGSPIRARLVGGYFRENGQNCMKITKSTFLRWSMGDMVEQVNFSGSGGIPTIPLSTRGNPAEKLLCFLDKTMNLIRTRTTTLTNQLLHVLTAIFVYVSYAGNFPWNCLWKAVWMIEKITDKGVNNNMYTLVKGSKGDKAI